MHIFDSTVTRTVHPLGTGRYMKDNSLPKDKHLPSGDNNPLKDKLLPKGENSDDILFFLEEKTENNTINASSFILSDIERKYMIFSEFIYNNPNGPSYYQTSTKSIYPRIIIIEKIDPIFVQNVMDFDFVDQIYLSSDCMEILNDTLRTQLYQLTRTQNYYARLFSISLEHNEDTREYLKAYLLITMNNNEETRIEINDKKPKKLGYYNWPWTKTKEHWE